MTRKRDREPLNGKFVIKYCFKGLMEGNTLGNGRMESSMDKGSTFQQKEIKERENGRKERGSDGLERLLKRAKEQ